MKRIAKRVLALLTLLLSIGELTMAQQSQTTPKKAPVFEPPGENLFKTYCAVCHGKDGKGNGPAAVALKVPPPDLTTLAKRHGGKFPTEYVGTALQYGVEDLKAHGSPDMPIWGPLFGPTGNLRKSPSLPLAQEREVDASVAGKIRDLSKYIESLQSK